MGNLFELALAPTAICSIYIFIRDKYEKEPIRLLALGLLFGAYSTIWILAFDAVLDLPFIQKDSNWKIFYTAFVTSAGVEESVKYMLLYFLVWRNKNFNERFDGIVYAVFISLGFAGVENIIYVMNPVLGGIRTALSRAIFSVPGHGFFGVMMGYYFALAKFEPEHKKRHLFQAWGAPWLLHGIYNSILLFHFSQYLFIFIPFVLYLWTNGLQKMKKHIEKSPFQ